MSAWITVVLAGVGSFALRFGALSLAGRRALPASLGRLSALVMPASFAGLCAVQLGGQVVDGTGAALAVAAPITVLVASRRSPALAALCGMGAIWSIDLAGRLL
jgi:hypothetical protein